MSSSGPERLRRRPRDLYKAELVAIVNRLVQLLPHAPSDDGKPPAAGTTLRGWAVAELFRVLAEHGLRASPNPEIEFELDLLRGRGNEPLGDVARSKIRAVHEWPCERTWNAAQAVVITPTGQTLFDCVCKVDASYGRCDKRKRRSSYGASLQRVPYSALVRRALIHAIATTPVLDNRDDPNVARG